MINRVCVGTDPTAGEKRARAFSMKENVIAFVAETKKIIEKPSPSSLPPSGISSLGLT